MIDASTLQARIIEAEAARHKLATGAAVAVTEVDGVGSTTYTKADLPMLESYIASLRSQLSPLTGSRASRRRPIHMGF